MPETEPIRNRWLRLKPGLSAKLNLLLLGAMVLIFALLGYFNIRLHRQHLEQAALQSAERVSDVIRRSTSEYMLRNDREGLYHAIQAMAAEPGMVKIRIFDQQGRITYTTDAAEANHVVDKRGEACYACHAQSQPLARLNRPDRFRIYRNGGGHRVLGIITPIENQPSCSNAACHAHPAQQQVLGVLDTDISLALADVQLAQSNRQIILYTACALLLIAFLSWFFVWRVVAGPVNALKKGTERLAQGDLGYQINVQSGDEIGELARSFNSMSVQLRAEHTRIWLGPAPWKTGFSKRPGNSSAPTNMPCIPRRWLRSERWRPCLLTKSTTRFPAFLPTPSCCGSGPIKRTAAAAAAKRSAILST